MSPKDQEATLSTPKRIFDNSIRQLNDDKYCEIKLTDETFTSKAKPNTMFGVLLDVSSSMEKPFVELYSYLTDEKVKQSHGIITTLYNIVNQEIITYERNDLVFVTAFGLNDTKCNGVNTCDFIALLKEIKEIDETLDRWETEYLSNGHEKLIQFAKHKNAPHAEPWIKEILSQKEAGILWEVLQDDDELTKKFLALIPPESTYNKYKVAKTAGQGTSWLRTITAAIGVGLGLATGGLGIALGAVGLAARTAGQKTTELVNNSSDDHEALKLAREAVHNAISKKNDLKTFLQKNQNAKSYFLKDVSNLLNALLQKSSKASSSRVQGIINSIKQYIYGGTSMVKALREAKEIFDSNPEINPKVLFILSDGEAADKHLGDPTVIAQELHSSNVTIVTCYFTSESIANPKRLVDEEDQSWSKGALDLYHMSSTMPNTSAPVTHLVNYDWELPLSGQCHLFLQANSLDIVEFLKVVVFHVTYGTDALIHMLGRLSLNTYINQSNDSFEARQQKGATSYANAIAAVFYLAMHRIVGREGGYPEFRTIRGQII